MFFVDLIFSGLWPPLVLRFLHMRFGAHVSAAGGLWKAGANGKKLDCEVIQIFTRSPQGGGAKPITDEDAEKFKQAMTENDIEDVYIHAPYYINLASNVGRIKHGSIRTLREELDRGTQLGCKAMMFHPGSAKDVGRKKGIKMVTEGINWILDGYTGACQFLIEIAAGAGEIMGDEFEEIATFIDGAERKNDIGVCFDTQHAFASGYDMRTKPAVNEMIKQFDKIIGLEKLVVSHCNDSKVELGAKRDRHEHIGEGEIGVAGIKALIQHPKLKKLDWILETPFEKNKSKKDPRQKDLEIIKSFR